LEVGKTFKVLTDLEFERMTALLQSHMTGENVTTAKARPTIVVEVTYDEVQKSPPKICSDNTNKRRQIS
jgi:DNA ligase-1